MHKNTDFSISNMSLKLEREGTISYYDIDTIALKNQIIKLVFMEEIMIEITLLPNLIFY